MQMNNGPDKPNATERPGFFATLLQGLIRDMVGYWLTFLVGTGVGAVICLYFGFPLIFSLLGGVLVLAVYIAWDQL